MSEVTLDTYARLLAHLACRRGVSTTQIMAEFRLSMDDVKAAEDALRTQLAGAWEARKGVTAMKFAAALGSELKRLGPLGDETPSADVAPPTLVDRPGHAALPAADVPSYLREARPRLPSPSGDLSLAGVHAPGSLPIAALAGPPPSPLAGTANMDLSDIVAAVQRGALPFAAATSSPADKGESPQEARPTLELPADAPASGGETVKADLSAIIASVSQGGLPWKRVEATETVDLSQFPLATYAEICGALARGESREQALARHGLTAEAFSRLAQAWAQRFQKEPGLLVEFKSLATSTTATARRTE